MTEGRFPDFYVVGAAKSGTTSLWNYLLQHPELYLVPDVRFKELGFFASDHGISNEEDYKSFFVAAQHGQKIGEVCNSYLTDPASAKRIKEAVPEAKIIISLRNPVDRAFSLYNWMVANGYEKKSEFNSALAEENKRKTDEDFQKSNAHGNPWLFRYFESGLFSCQVQRYFEVFGKSNCLVLLFDELIKNPVSVSQKCYSFLSVDQEFKPATDKLNEKKQPRSQALQYFVKSVLPKVRDSLGLPKGLLGNTPSKILKLNKKSGNQNELDLMTKKKLLEKYKEDILKTQKLIEIDLSRWLIL